MRENTKTNHFIDTKNEEDLEEFVTRSSVVLIVEWNGGAIPQTWYNRLHSFGLYSRRDLFQNAELQKEDGRSLLQWRSEQTGRKKTEIMRGLILQEGIIQCADASLAHQLQAVAKNLGAAHTWVGNLTITNAILPEKDMEVFLAIEKKTSKRGVKPKHETGHYTVTCFEEGKTFHVDCDSTPVGCPSCGSVFFQARLGYPQKYKFNFDKKETTIEEFWMRTRFATSQFEVPMFDDTEGNHPLQHQVGMYNPPNAIKDFVNNLFHDWDCDGIKKLRKEYEKDPGIAMELLDAVYCASKKARASRVIERQSIWMNHVSGKASGNWSFLVPDDDSIDMLDVVKISSRWAKYL